MTVLKVLRLHIESDAEIYSKELSNFYGNYPHYKLPYLDLFYGGHDNAVGFLLMDANEEAQVLMPVYLREIDKLQNDTPWYDAISPWGYGGPICRERTDPSLIGEFWKLVDQWYKDNHVIAEFIRFNLIENHVNYTGVLVPFMHNIKGEIKPEEEIWTNYNRKVRKNVNRALREELSVKIVYENISEQDFEDFYRIFIHTMDRTHAKKNYYFSREVLMAFINEYPYNAAIALTMKGDTPISSELVLVSTDTIYSFVGGTLSDYFGIRPNEILKHEVIKWAYDLGKKYYVLGGGYGQDDGIFRYKQAFFPEDVCTFYTGRKILDENRYFQLSNTDPDSYDIMQDFFPVYREKT